MRRENFLGQGYTLIEVLVIVIVMGLVFAALTPSLARAVTTDPLLRTMALVRDADRLARQQAIGHGAQLAVIETHLVIIVDDTVTSQQALPEHCTVSWTPVGEQSAGVPSCTYDRSGRSLDLVVRCSLSDAAPGASSLTTSLTTMLHGLTGLWDNAPLMPSAVSLSPGVKP